jgi:hypothetical protein
MSKGEKMKPQILTKDVLLFKNAIEDPQKWMDIINASKNGDEVLSNWEIWPPWGLGCKVYAHTAEFAEASGDGKWLIEQSLDKFWDALAHYNTDTLSQEYIDLLGPDRVIPISCKEEASLVTNPQNWHHADVAVYESIDTPAERPLSMEWHVDRRAWFGGQKHMLTFNLYPNDDYEGGEISFIDIENAEKKVDGEGREYYLVDKPITYKPEAGDALLFRTDVFHSVEPVVGNKFYVRQFLTAPFPPEFFEERKKFDNDEDWVAHLAAIDKEGLKGFPFQMLLHDELSQVHWESVERRKVCIIKK